MIDSAFDRIQVSILNVFIASVVLYIIIFFSSERNNDVEES